MVKKIAIIGSGISGLTCAYLLNEKYDIEVLEANDYIGGHTHTVDINGLAIDTGFIVFNDRTYPNFQKILDQLGVSYRPTEMSFSVRNDNWGLEYNGNTLNSLFADRKNFFRPKFYRLILDILKFNKLAKQVNESDSRVTLGEFVHKNKFSDWFINGYILPMGSAIWSMGMAEMLDFPFVFFAKFFNNHGLLDVTNRPQWYTINGGSRNYIPKLTAGFADKILLNSPVSKVIRHADHIKLVLVNGESKKYDEVICACHSDQALQLLDNPSDDEQKILGAIKYSNNDVILHRDTSLLPRNKLAHASWNYLISDNSDNKATLTYNMNILQGLNTQTTYCVTLNSSNLIDESQICAKFNYAHPVYSDESVAAQAQWSKISGCDRVYYCGAYWSAGFHEDGVKSALMVCKQLGVEFVE